MNPSLGSLCLEFTRRVRYNLAILHEIPNRHIMKALAKDGYRLVSCFPTKSDIRSAEIAVGHAALFLRDSTVKNRNGIDVILDDGQAHEEFRQAVRRAAAEHYGVKPRL